jgi:hypothetical protein
MGSKAIDRAALWGIWVAWDVLKRDFGIYASPMKRKKVKYASCLFGNPHNGLSLR